MTTSIDDPALQPDSQAAADRPALSHRQVLTILSGLLLGMFLASLDQNIVSVAIVRIANSLHGFDQQAWATTAYLITSTISTPLYGKLADIYGRKSLFLIAIGLFVVGSFACTFATSMYELAGFRAFQGLGAGGLTALTLTILGDIVPPRERARYQGYFMMVFGVATVLGPVLGGVLSGFDRLGGIDGWRWVFLVNVPIGIIALVVVAKVLNLPHHRVQTRVDWLGALTLSICVVPLLIVAEQGRGWGWTASRSTVCYAIGAVGLVLFVFVEYRMKDAALIPLRLFKNSTFAVTILGSFLVGTAMFGSISMVPLYLQVVRGYSPTAAGLLMLPMVAGIISGSMFSGQLVRRTGHYKILPVAGTLLIALGAALYSRVSYDSAMWHPLLVVVVMGLGLGCCMQTLIIAAQNAVPRSDMGVSTASATFFRQVGGTLGVAIFLTVLFNQLPHKIVSAFGGLLPKGFDTSKLGAIQSNTSGIHALPAAVRDPILIGFTNSLHVVFLLTAGVGILAFLVLAFMREIPLADSPPPPAAETTGGPVDEVAAAAAEWGEEQVYLGAAQVISEPEPVLAGAVNGHGNHRIGGYRATDTVAPIATAAAASPETVVPKAVPSRTVVAEKSAAERAITENATVVASGDGPVATGSDGRRTIGGLVRRSDGHPVADAALTLIDPRGHQVSRATGSGDGGYAIEPPTAGNYVLIVSASGHQPAAVNVGVDGRPQQLHITLQGAGELTGVVRSASDQALLSGATVTLTDQRGEVVGAAVTGTDGGYRCEGVVAGIYTLVAVAEHMRPNALTLVVPDSGLLEHDIALVPMALLTGAVSADGRAVPDALVTVLDEAGDTVGTAQTDEQGRYVVTDLSEGQYTVVTRGYPPVRGRITVGSGEAAYDVRLGYDFEQGSEQA